MTGTRHVFSLIAVLGIVCMATHDVYALPPTTDKTLIAVHLPGGEQGLDLDDITYIPALQRIVVPAGQTGALVMIDPRTNALTSISGISTRASAADARESGTSSAAYGDGMLFASDHSDRAIVIVDPKQKRILARASLAGDSDYIRYLASQHELWVTEPRAEQIQIFRFTAYPKPALTPETTIPVPGGPESLAFDSAHHRVYTNLWQAKTVVIDVVSHKVVHEWVNGCKGGRGLAMDTEHAYLFVACKEGAVSVLSLKQNGKILAQGKAGAGIDIISYSPALHHLYVPGSQSATLTVFDVSASGSLKPLSIHPTAEHAHCVADDGHGRVFVCNPRAGTMLVIEDRQEN